jgi:hypothetical protein
MTMKKTSGGDSPLRQGAGIVMCSAKLIRYLGFFRRGVFIDEGASSEVDQGDLTHRGHG